MHRTGVHGGPSPRWVGAVVAVAFVFGTAVLIAEALDNDDGGQLEMSKVSLSRGATARANRHSAARRPARV